MVKESTARNVYSSLFQSRGEAPANARSPALTNFALGASRSKSSSADLVRRVTVRNVTNSVRYTGAYSEVGAYSRIYGIAIVTGKMNVP